MYSTMLIIINISVMLKSAEESLHAKRTSLLST